MKKMEDVFAVVFADKSEVCVGDVAKTFATILMIGENNLDSIKNAKAKLTIGEWNAFVNSISSSFLTSLYVNAAETEGERAKRLRAVTEAAKDLLKGVVES